MKVDFPLYRLFLKLRNEGFSLGTEQYLLLIKVLHHKKYILDLGIIQRSCQTLWANSKEEIWIFNRHFNLMIHSETEVLQEIDSNNGESKNANQTPDLSIPLQEKKKDTENTLIPPREEETEFAADTNPKTESPSTNDALPGQFNPMEAKWQDHFLLEGNVSPITLRQMQQSWRYLRKWKKEGAKTEIDLEKTFAEVAQKGFFTAPVKSAPRINSIELLLIVDRKGSMLPFHGLLDELIHSALNGGRFNKARCLYFHDYPTKYLYRQPQMIEAIDLKELANTLNPKRTVAMVISDAGAARRTFSDKRVSRTEKFKNYLKENTANFVWLNPMPKDRWEGCSAEDIAEFFPMFEVNQEGLNQAIDILRGKKK